MCTTGLYMWTEFRVKQSSSLGTDVFPVYIPCLHWIMPVSVFLKIWFQG